MKKDLTNLFKKSNLKPRERVMLLVHNQVINEREGKEPLTEADIKAISEGWTPKNDAQVKEYNRYLRAWKTAGGAEMDAQTCYLSAFLSIRTLDRVLCQIELLPAVYKVEKRFIELGEASDKLSETELPNDFIDKILAVADDFETLKRYISCVVRETEKKPEPSPGGTAGRLRNQINDLFEEKPSAEKVLTLGPEISELFDEQIKKFKHFYNRLLAFEDIFNKLSKIYQIDLTYRIKRWKADLEGLAFKFNQEIQLNIWPPKRIVPPDLVKIKFNPEVKIDLSDARSDYCNGADNYLKEIGLFLPDILDDEENEGPQNA